MRGNKNFVLMGAAVTAGLLVILIQLAVILWTEGLLPWAPGNPSAVGPEQRRALVYGWTPLGYLAVLLTTRPTVKGALLAAAIYFPFNIVIGFNLVVVVLLAYGRSP